MILSCGRTWHGLELTDELREEFNDLRLHNYLQQRVVEPGMIHVIVDGDLFQDNDVAKTLSSLCTLKKKS